MSPRTRKDENIWKLLFDECNVLSDVEKNGYCIVTAKEIHRVVPGYEPRNIARFISTKAVPQIFRENNLSILPTENGAYMIAPFIIFHKQEKEPYLPVVNWAVRRNLQSFDSLHFKFNEATAVNFAYMNGILENFLEDTNIVPAVSGRMHTGEFRFDVLLENGSRKNIKVNRVQMEIDASYEGEHFLSLIEAKNERMNDIIIRQLYFPYRTLAERVSKEIKNIFMVYYDRCFDMYQYEFAEPEYFNSITLAKHCLYKLTSTDEGTEYAVSR